MVSTVNAQIIRVQLMKMINCVLATEFACAASAFATGISPNEVKIEKSMEVWKIPSTVSRLLYFNYLNDQNHDNNFLCQFSGLLFQLPFSKIIFNSYIGLLKWQPWHAPVFRVAISTAFLEFFIFLFLAAKMATLALTSFQGCHFNCLFSNFIFHSYILLQSPAFRVAISTALFKNNFLFLHFAANMVTLSCTSIQGCHFNCFFQKYVLFLFWLPKWQP